MVMALVAVWLLYRHLQHLHGTDTLGLLYFKHAVAVPSHTLHLPKYAEWPFVIVC